MAHSIRIEFTGLSLWVPDGDKLYVLLPKHGHAKTEHEHHQRLYFKRALQGGGNPPPSEMNIRHHSLEVADGASPSSYDGIPSDIVDIRDFAGRAPRSLFSTNAPHLATRIVLPLGMITVLDSGERWWIGTRPAAHMTHKVMWTGRQQNGPTSIQVGTLLNDPPTMLPVEPDGEVLELHIYNVPKGDLPGNTPAHRRPRCRDNPDHFRAYYDLILQGKEPPTTPRQLPHFAGRYGECRKTGNDAGTAQYESVQGFVDPLAPRMGGSPFTCMMATTEPEP
jgi:hypothetical protein